MSSSLRRLASLRPQVAPLASALRAPLKGAAGAAGHLSWSTGPQPYRSGVTAAFDCPPMASARAPHFARGPSYSSIATPPTEAHHTQTAELSTAAASQLSTAGAPDDQGLSPMHDMGLGLSTRHMAVHTLELLKQLEAAGMNRRQAELLTIHLTQVIVAQRQYVDDECVNNDGLEKVLLQQETKYQALKLEVEKSQEMHGNIVTKDIDRIQQQLDKIKAEIRYEVDKLTASQRLDLNLEKGRMRDELQALRDKANEMGITFDKEMNQLRAGQEQNKNDTLKWVLGILTGFCAAGLAAARLLKG